MSWAKKTILENCLKYGATHDFSVGLGGPSSNLADINRF